uniref:Reverse transcriptase Ty1/copia-type domain-containing protein n=1 Tax=Cannabis sativa TaxID=3483 RepID=A0A803PJ91_CANSA
MKALLVHQELYEALLGEKSLPVSIKDKMETLTKAHSAIILNLGDKVLRKVAEEDIAAGAWLKLESLYMTKSLMNRFYLKQTMYSFKMMEDKYIGVKIDEFNKLIINLENIGVTIEDEDQALLLFSSLPKSFAHFKDRMLYGRESITLDDVQSALNSKELNQRRDATVGSDDYDSAGALLVTSKNSDSEWILDSGCSFHMTPNKSWFEEFTSDTYGTVYLGDKKSCRMVGIGIIVHEEPTSYAKTVKSKDWKKWNGAMSEEMHPLNENQTWDVIPLPEDGKVIGCKWKEGILDVQEARYKSRLLAKGFSQTEGVDYNEVFSPVVKHRPIRILFTLVAFQDLELGQLDVKPAFLYGHLDERILMKQLEGFEEAGKEHWGVFDIQKSLTRYVFTMFGTIISWKANFQKVVALLTIEAEYMALTKAIKEALWLNGLMEEIKLNQKERTKHIDIKLHFIQEDVEKKVVKIAKVPTKDNHSDIVTKGKEIDGYLLAPHYRLPGLRASLIVDLLASPGQNRTGYFYFSQKGYPWLGDTNDAPIQLIPTLKLKDRANHILSLPTSRQIICNLAGEENFKKYVLYPSGEGVASLANPPKDPSNAPIEKEKGKGKRPAAEKERDLLQAHLWPISHKRSCLQLHRQDKELDEVNMHLEEVDKKVRQLQDYYDGVGQMLGVSNHEVTYLTVEVSKLRKEFDAAEVTYKEKQETLDASLQG